MARVAGVDLPRDKRGEVAIQYIYGIGKTMALSILGKAGVDHNKRVKDWSDDEAALLFWRCLGVADDPAAPDDLRRQARRRMKQLDVELHGRYMRRASPLHG